MSNQIDIFVPVSATERLRQWAKEEIERYHIEIKIGEPPFPRYAYDVLELLDDLEAMKGQLLASASASSSETT